MYSDEEIYHFSCRFYAADVTLKSDEINAIFTSGLLVQDWDCDGPFVSHTERWLELDEKYGKVA